MPWGCSKRILPLAVLLAVAAVGWPPAGRTADWLAGVFPVVNFLAFTSGYGLRYHPIAGDYRHHDGVDIAAPLGSPVLSWWGGTVTEVMGDGGCGNGLVIRSGDYEHVYCHLAGQADGQTYRSGSVLITLGQRVRPGELIGHVGITGNTTGPHLHWGIRYRGVSMDPTRILQAMAASRRRALAMGRPLNVRVVR